MCFAQKRKQGGDILCHIGAGGSGDSDDETTTTKTVVINGVNYLETTNEENGVTSVQRTVIDGVGQEQ